MCLCVRVCKCVFVCSLCCCFSPCSLKSDSSDLSLLWFIETYCWMCTGQGFLPTQAWSTLLFGPPQIPPPPPLSPFLCGLAVLQNSCVEGGQRGLYYLKGVGVCIHRWCCWCCRWWSGVINSRSQGRDALLRDDVIVARREGAGGQRDLSPDRLIDRQTGRPNSRKASKNMQRVTESQKMSADSERNKLRPNSPETKHVSHDSV